MAKFLFYRRKTEKWGHMLLMTAYILLFFNVFALIMTTLNIMGVFDHKGSFFYQDDIYKDR